MAKKQLRSQVVFRHRKVAKYPTAVQVLQLACPKHITQMYNQLKFTVLLHFHTKNNG